MTAPDLVIAGGRVVDPARSVDEVADIAVAAGRVTAAAPGARRTIDADGLLVVPGLIDLHVHVYSGVSHYGVEPDATCLQRGVTTVVDTGSAGAQTFADFRRHVVDAARTRVLAYLNVADHGMISPLVGELEDIRWVSVERTVACALEHPDTIVGVKVRLGAPGLSGDPDPALRPARAAADQLGLPLMVHIANMTRPLSWLLPQLGEGDVVTHSFHGQPEGGLLDGGRVIPEAFAARDRGVVFDVGHGMGSFAFSVARAALDQGFPPDTISSDLHAYNVDGPVFDQTTTMSKLLHLGLELTTVIDASTAAPARALRRADTLGSLAVGREADITVLELVRGERMLVDAHGETERALTWVEPRWVVRGGAVVEV